MRSLIKDDGFLRSFSAVCLRVSACALLASCAQAGPKVADRVSIDPGPVRIQESKTTRTTKQVITGPKGTRTVTTRSQGNTLELPTTVSNDDVSDIDAQGTEDTGLVVERKTVYQTAPGLGGSGGVVIVTEPDRPAGTPIVRGNGQVHTESQSQTKTLPSVKINTR